MRAAPRCCPDSIVSRLLLIFVFVIWLTGWAGAESRASSVDWAGCLAFVSFYVLLVMLLGLWSRLLARRVGAENFQRSLRRFNRTMFAARLMVPTWFAVGVFIPQMGWVSSVRAIIMPLLDFRLGLIDVGPLLHFPSSLVGTLPAMLAWAGLIWAQYPADRALREQNMLAQLESELPLHAPPRWRAYFASNLRLGVLFIVAPVLMIMLFHDLALLGGLAAFKSRLQYGPVATNEEQQAAKAFVERVDLLANLFAAGFVFLIAPEILRRVLQTHPLPDGPLRRRLAAMCERQGLRYRQILLWNTQHNMGNAAVMGLIPQVRYILLSDLLLETMSDEQIEAVFAHEAGHIVHRHMAWYIVFFIGLFLFFAGPGQKLADWLESSAGVPGLAIDILGILGLAGGMLLGFGFLSRRCERQADVYAARTMQELRDDHQLPVQAEQVPELAGISSMYGAGEVVVVAPPLSIIAPAASSPIPSKSFVGHYGATVFASALYRVAIVNNIPISAPSWCHGSIRRRMDYIKGLSHDPALTGQFDRSMSRLYGTLLFLIAAAAATMALTQL